MMYIYMLNICVYIYIYVIDVYRDTHTKFLYISWFLDVYVYLYV